MKKIAIVNQRYGLEVNGGSELYTREIAERLKSDYEVHVLTSCALNYTDWANYYQEGIEDIHGVTVHRFPVEKLRNQQEFAQIHKLMEVAAGNLSEKKTEEWLRKMGPYCPALVQYAADYKDEFDLFIVVTYLYYPAVKCLEVIGDKTIFIPTAHDEPFLYFPLYRKAFAASVGYVFLTMEEKELIFDVFHVENKVWDVMGAGIDVPQNIETKTFKERYGLDEYIIYVGRIDVGKGVPDLFRNFLRYKERNPGNLKLVLMGREEIPIPQHPDIVYLGFVDERDKFAGIEGAKMLVLPSRFESLSISVLEAMAVGTPVLVNGECEVLRGHCNRSGAGLYYKNYYEFECCIRYMDVHGEEYNGMRKNAQGYIEQNYNWNAIMTKYKALINKVLNGGQA